MRRSSAALLFAAAAVLGPTPGAAADEDRVWEGHLSVGPPTSPSAQGHYWSPDGPQQSSPLENFTYPRRSAEVVLLDAPPRGSWRPLFDLSIRTDGRLDTALEMKQRAAANGADAVLVDATAHRERAALGTALRLAKPGSEAYSGIYCATYSPYNPEVRDRIGNYSLATVQQVEGPAMAAGVQIGDFILSATINGKLAVGNCSDFNTALQQAGPGAAVDLTLWQPWRGPHPSMVVNVPFARSAGLEVATTRAGVSVVEVVAGSPAQAAGVQQGDLLLSVDGRAVQTQEQAVEAIRNGPIVQQLSLRRGQQPLALGLQTSGNMDASFYNLPRIGVLVVGVAADSRAFAGGLAPGDIILSHGDWHELRNLPAAPTGEQLQVQRDGQARVVHFRAQSVPAQRYRSAAP